MLARTWPAKPADSQKFFCGSLMISVLTAGFLKTGHLLILHLRARLRSSEGLIPSRRGGLGKLKIRPDTWR